MIVKTIRQTESLLNKNNDHSGTMAYVARHTRRIEGTYTRRQAESPKLKVITK
jgi:hypothetical protein